MAVSRSSSVSSTSFRKRVATANKASGGHSCQRSIQCLFIICIIGVISASLKRTLLADTNQISYCIDSLQIRIKNPLNQKKGRSDFR